MDPALDFDQALKCAIISKEAYRDFSPEFRFSAFPALKPELIEGEITDTQCFVLKNETEQNRRLAQTELFIVFRGSDSRTDWGLNLNFSQAAVQFVTKPTIERKILRDDRLLYPFQGKSSSGAKMHQGFANAYRTVRDAIHHYLQQHSRASVTVTGHSLGGAIATLCAVDVQYNFGPELGQISLYTYGSPRVGNSGFRESFNRRVPRSYRFVYGMDLVPAFPRPWQNYRHVDQEQRIGDRFSLDFLFRRFQDHKIDRYITEIKALAQQKEAPVSREVMEAARQAKEI